MLKFSQQWERSPKKYMWFNKIKREALKEAGNPSSLILNNVKIKQTQKLPDNKTLKTKRIKTANNVTKQ